MGSLPVGAEIHPVTRVNKDGSLESNWLIMTNETNELDDKNY